MSQKEFRQQWVKFIIADKILSMSQNLSLSLSLSLSIYLSIYLKFIAVRIK